MLTRLIYVVPVVAPLGKYVYEFYALCDSCNDKWIFVILINGYVERNEDMIAPITFFFLPQ